MNWREFPDSAKVWIYATPKELSKEEQSQIITGARKFLSQWQAHGQPLTTDVELYHDHFLVFFVNEEHAQVSGCSIDASVAFVRQLEEQMGLSFLDRTRVYYRMNGKVRDIDFREVENLKEKVGINVFNNSITNLKDFRNGWMLPLEESWMG